MIKLSYPFVVETMRRDGLNVWHLYDDKLELLRQDDREASIDHSLDKLTSAVNAMRGDTLTIKAGKAGTKATLRTFYVDLSGYNQGSRNVGTPPAGSQVPSQLYEQLAAQQVKIAVDEVRAHMQREIDALKAASDDSFIGFLERTSASWMPGMVQHVGPGLGQALQGISALISQGQQTAPPAPVLNGHPETAIADTQIILPEAAAQAIKSLYEKNPNFTDNLVKLAALEKEKLDKLVSMLNNPGIMSLL